MIHLVQELSAWLADPTAMTHLWQGELWQAAIDSSLVAQFNQNVFSRFNAALDDFIQTGKIWVFLIGLILGYLIRGFTTYG